MAKPETGSDPIGKLLVDWRREVDAPMPTENPQYKPAVPKPKRKR